MKYTIEKKDLKIERFAASSKGGQNANKTEVNVRMTHIPSGLKAQATGERSLEQNLKNALNVLVQRIIQWIEDKREKAPPKKPATFGYQDRTYYLDGDCIVVDHNTGARQGAQKTLNGNLDIFIETFLRNELNA